MKRAGFLIIFACFSLSAEAQTIAPNGEAYEAPDSIDGYRWYSGVRPADPDASTILYDGKSDWEVTSPEACYYACSAFLGCEAFLFTEPRLKTETPTCRMLSGPMDDLITERGSHLFLSADFFPTEIVSE